MKTPTPKLSVKDWLKNHISDWVVDDGNNRLLWKDKAPTPNEVLDLLHLQAQKYIEQVEGMRRKSSKHYSEAHFIVQERNGYNLAISDVLALLKKDL